ncbi:Fc.00g030190.m01.CDS01 [Cosmosporella sp. VM-42]
MARSVLSLVISSFLLAGLTAADQPFYDDLDGYNREVLGMYPNQTFHSTDIIAPLFQVNTFEPGLVDSSGYIFLNGYYGGKGGPAIISSKDLSLVYANFTHDQTFDARAQVKGNEKYLTFFEGPRGGVCRVVDDAYNLKWTVTARGLGNTKADLHEFQLTDEGTGIMAIFQDIKFDLSPIGGRKDAMLGDGVFQEVDLETNNVLYVWRASSHFNLTDTYVPYNPDHHFMGGEGFDWFHINNIYKNKDKNYLVSSRALSMITLIDGESGDPIWILGGKKNMFKDLSDGKATNFRNQHHPRYVNGNMSQISFFDNHGLRSGICFPRGPIRYCSRGVVVELDYKAMTAKVLREFWHPQHVASQAEGSVQGLGNGNFMVGWGYNPSVTEHAPDGKVVMDFQRGAFPNLAGARANEKMTVYRAWKMDWVGRPVWGPDIAAASKGNTTANAIIYVSWNGNTEIDKWEVYASDDKDNINTNNRPMGKSSRNGFETEINLDGKIPPYAKAVALSRDNKIQGFTAVVDIRSGKLYGQSSSIWNSTSRGSSEYNDQYGDSKDDGDDQTDASGRLGTSFGLILSAITATFLGQEL